MSDYECLIRLYRRSAGCLYTAVNQSKASVEADSAEAASCVDI